MNKDCEGVSTVPTSARTEDATHEGWRYGRGSRVTVWSVFVLHAAAVVVAAQNPRPSETDARAGTKKKANDLARRLIRGETGGSDVMSRIVEQMMAVEHQLTRNYDAGAETQALERRILKELESAIAGAVRRGQGKAAAGEAGEMRRRSGRRRADRPVRENGGKPGPAGKAGGDAAGGSAAPNQPDPGAGGPLRASRRGWGNLPPRDREEVIQGADEKSLERYRAWIERYYRALAEDGHE